MGSGARREPASLRTDIPTCTDEGSLLRFHTWKRLDLAGAASIATLGVAILAALNARRAYQRQDRLFAHNVRSSTQQEDSGQFRLPPAESIDAAHKFSRGRFWWGLVSTTILSLFCTAILWAEGWPQSAPEGEFDKWLSNVTGWVDPGTSLTFSLAVLGLIATITISVSFATPSRSVIDQVETNFWSAVLTGFSAVSSMVAFTVSLVAWPSTIGVPRLATGVAVLSTLVAFGCLVLTASIRLKTDNAAMRRRSISQINQKINQLENRRQEVFGMSASVSTRNFRSVFILIVHCLAVSLLFASLAYSVILLAPASEPKSFGWSFTSAIITTSAIWFFTHLRWSVYRSTRRWKLETTSKFYALLWVAFITLFFVADLPSTWTVAVFGAFPLISAALVSLSRPDRILWGPVRCVRWFARPVWDEVDRSLQIQLGELRIREIARRTAPLRM